MKGVIVISGGSATDRAVPFLPGQFMQRFVGREVEYHRATDVFDDMDEAERLLAYRVHELTEFAEVVDDRVTTAGEIVFVRDHSRAKGDRIRFVEFMIIVAEFNLMAA